MASDQLVKNYRKFVPFAKVDEAKREVSGIVTAEVPDKEGETCDYFGSKPYFQSWSSEFEKATNGKSCGNLRLMHTLTVVGKGLAIDFRDDVREIHMTFKVTDDKAWSDVQEGVLTGFSQGGKYVKSPDANGRYTASPSEVSLVDNPCLGVCHFAYVRSDGAVEMRKVRDHALTTEDSASVNQNAGAAGTGTTDVAKAAYSLPPITLEQCLRAARGEDPLLTDEQIEAFETFAALIEKGKGKTKRVAGEDLPASAFAYVGDKDDTSTWKLPIKFSTEEKTKSHIRNALARFNQTEGIPAGERAKVLARIKAAAKKHGIDTEDSGDKEKAADALELVKAANAEVAKGMFDVSRFAELLSQLKFIQDMAQFEAEIEDDGSTVPADLLAQLKELCRVFLAMAEEEVEELTAEKDENGAVMALSAAAAMQKASLLLDKAAEKISNTKTDAGTPAEGQNVSNTNASTGTDLTKKAGFLSHMKKAKQMAQDHCDAMCAHIDKMMGDDDGDEGKAAKAAAATAAAGATQQTTQTQAAAPAAAAQTETTAQTTQKAAGSEDLAKAMNEQFQGVLKGMQDQFKTFMEGLASTLAPPKAAQNGSARAVTKTQDNGGGNDDQQDYAEPVFKAKGAPDLAVSEEYRKALKGIRGVPAGE